MSTYFQLTLYVNLYLINNMEDIVVYLINNMEDIVVYLINNMEDIVVSRGLKAALL